MQQTAYEKAFKYLNHIDRIPIPPFASYEKAERLVKIAIEELVASVNESIERDKVNLRSKLDDINTLLKKFASIQISGITVEELTKKLVPEPISTFCYTPDIKYGLKYDMYGGYKNDVLHHCVSYLKEAKGKKFPRDKIRSHFNSGIFNLMAEFKGCDRTEREIIKQKIVKLFNLYIPLEEDFFFSRKCTDILFQYEHMNCNTLDDYLTISSLYDEH